MPILCNPWILCNFVVFHYIENINSSIDDVKLLFHNAMIIERCLSIVLGNHRT